MRAGVKKVLRQAWDSPTAEQAERVLGDLARRLAHDAPGVSASIHEGLDEMLTVIRLGLPAPLRRALGCTNTIESLMTVLRQVCRNVKRWLNARMAAPDLVSLAGIQAISALRMQHGDQAVEQSTS